MNKFLIYLGVGVSASAMLFGFTSNSSSTITDNEPAIEIPENINAIFKNSCYGCHNSESKNAKAKKKLQIDMLTSMSTGKLVSKLNKIAKEVEKGDMPTEKFAEKYPERVPTDEVRKTLVDWAKSTAEELAGE